MRKWRWKN